MVFKSLQGSSEPGSTGGSSGLCFDNTVDLKGGEGTAPTVASQVSGNISEKRGPRLWSVRCKGRDRQQRFPLISGTIMSSSKYLCSSALCRLFISEKNALCLHWLLLTNAVFFSMLWFLFSFSFTFTTPLPWAFYTVKGLNMTPSQRLCLTIRHTKHLFRGQRKECCLSTGLVGEDKRPRSDNLNLIHRIDWGIVSSPFFLLAFPFVNTKLRWPINITWCGDAKQELMTGVCVYGREKERVYGMSLWDCA